MVFKRHTIDFDINTGIDKVHFSCSIYEEVWDEDRDICFDNVMVINTTNLEGFKEKPLEGARVFNVGIFATFSDGTAAFVKRQSQKEFKKRGGIQPYIDLLQKYKEYNPQHGHYKILDYYIQGNNSSDAIVIPEFQFDEDGQSQVRKLTKDNELL